MFRLKGREHDALPPDGRRRPEQNLSRGAAFRMAANLFVVRTLFFAFYILYFL